MELAERGLVFIPVASTTFKSQHDSVGFTTDFFITNSHTVSFRICDFSYDDSSSSTSRNSQSVDDETSTSPRTNRFTTFIGDTDDKFSDDFTDDFTTSEQGLLHDG